MATDSETKLSLQLKTLCEQHGNKWKEKNPKESAKILRRLGILYKNKCSNHLSNTLEKKITFIQSAALLNCALEREHNNSTKKQIKKDLQNLCFEVLLSAKAKRHKFDLINFADELKKDIDKWRENVKRKTEMSFPILNQIKKKSLQQFKNEQQKINAMEALQDEITEKYKELIRKVSQMTIKALGDLPCDFALVGMGSIARKEITPYSDFENIIVMQEGVQNNKDSYKTMLEYFRWYAAVFQVILINLRETVLPSVAIPSLNDYTSKDENWFYDAYTKRGISYNGMMPHLCKSPLGRQPTEKKPWEIELIKPVSLMAEYLKQEQDLKNGYHLRDILTNICFVDGNQDVYQMFENTIEDLLAEEQSNSMEEVIKKITDDMRKHITKLSIFSIIDNDNYNIKQFAYRSVTIFIAGFAKLNNIKLESCFDAVRKMQKQEFISEEFSIKLQFAVALACEIRLKACFQHGYQYDYVESSSEHSAEDISINLKNAVGVKCCYDYLEIACCLQYDIIAWTGLENTYIFYHPVTLCIAISSFLQISDYIIAAKGYIKDHPILQDEQKIESTLAMEDSDNDWSKSFDVTLEESIKPIELNNPHKQCLGALYSKMQIFNHGLIKFFSSQTSLSALEFLNADTNSKNNFCILTEFGEYFFTKGVYFDALFCFKTALEQNQKRIGATEPCQQIVCLFWIGMCLSGKKDYDGAKKLFSEALEQYRLLSNRCKNLSNFEGDCFKQIGICQQNLNFEEEAYQSFEAAITSYIDKQESDAQLDSIGFCVQQTCIHLFNTNRFEKALLGYEKLLVIYSKCSNVNLIFKAKCFFYMGCCLQNLNQCKKASKHLHEAISLYQKDMRDQTKSNVYIALDFAYVGNCFLIENDHRQALENLSKSLKLWENLLEDYPDDKDHLLNAATTHRQLGKCLAKFNFHKESIEHFERALTTFQTFGRTLDCLNLNKSLGNSFKAVENYKKACCCYQTCFSLINDVTTPSRVKADLNRLLGGCMRKLHNDEGNKFINLALDAYLKLHECKNGDGLSLLRCIGMCYWNLGNRYEARNYLEQFVALSENPKSLLTLTDRLHVVTTLKLIGISWNIDNHRESALEFFERSLQKVLDLPKSLEYEHEIAFLYNQIGEHWLRKSCEDVARSNLEKAESLHDSLKQTLKGKYNLCYTYKHLGRVFSQQDCPDYSRAISYFKKAEEMFSDLDNQRFRSDIAWLMKNMGRCYKEQNKFAEAIKNFKKSAETLRSLSENSSVLCEIAYVLKNVGLCYQHLRNHDLAISNFEESVFIYSKEQKLFDKAWLLKKMAFSFNAKNACSKAISCLQDAMAIYENMPVEKQNKNELENVKGMLKSFRKNFDDKRHHLPKRR